MLVIDCHIQKNLFVDLADRKEDPRRKTERDRTAFRRVKIEMKMIMMKKKNVCP